MQCINCGTELIPGKQFCHACGARAVQACPNCGNTVQPGFRFCPDCGFQLVQTEANTAAPAAAAVAHGASDRFARLAQSIPEELAQKIKASTGAVAGERKLVTVLFCDLVGSTAIAERLDPEEYHDLLEEYLALAFAEIYRFDGIVNQLAGDGMMALFGAPVAHEDAPQRAVRAALAVREALNRFNEQARGGRGSELQVRVGIHTGPVVVGTVGNDLKMDYTAIGDTTNLASRMQSLAQPGTILISEATHRRVRGFFQLKPAGTFTVKGKSQPVATYEVLGLTDTVTPMAIAAARGLTPFVGRQAELAQLLACYKRLEDDLGQVVAIVGDAGSGKSRLLYEFRQQVESSEDVIVFEARCSSLSQLQPYAPWVSMLRQFFGLEPRESPAATCEKITRKVRPLDEQLERIYPYLCHMLSLEAPGLSDRPADELKGEEFEAISLLVGRLSHQAPVLIIFEDLHWIDEASREMLELAVSRIQTARVMLVVSHRRDYQPSWRTHAAFTQLNLRSLSDQEVNEVIRAVAGGPLPAELEQLIGVKAEGNPFFAEEITRALIEEGDVVRTNGNLELSRPAEQIRIPGTVEEVIGARVDRFGPAAKRTLQVAAVFGRQFRASQLSELLNGEGIDVPSQLVELERRGVIHRKSALFEDEFRFGESLTQEVAYESLLLKERRLLHERIGRLLEVDRSDKTVEHAALLAHHFTRSDSRDKAIAALLRAGQGAERLPSYRLAVDFYRQAWELADAALRDALSPPDESLQHAAAEAALSLCRMTVIYSWTDEAYGEKVATRGRQLAEALGNAEIVAGLYTYHGMIIMSGSRERFAEGLAMVEKGFTVADQAGLSLTAINISRGLAWSYLFDGQLALARDTFEQVVHALEHTEHRTRLSDLYLGSRFMRDSGRYLYDDMAQAQTALEETYELAVRGSNRTVQSGSAAALALVCFLRANYGEANNWAERGLDLAEKIGNVAAIRTSAIVTLLARIELGETVAAARYLDLIEQQGTALGDLGLKSNLVVEACLAVGELKRARRLAELAYEHAGGHLREAVSAIALGDVMRHFGLDHWPDAERWYRHAIDLAERIEARAALGLALLGSAELAAAQGDSAKAAQAAERSVRLLREVGLGRYLRRAERLRSEVGAGAEVLA
jgi:class 3 adenylate cyclase/ABC-type lipoprotein export system ATPase subunit/tetratricopeptide (TPR) repeat protein